MNDENLIKLLESVRTLQPRGEILMSVKKRVFDAIEKNEGKPAMVASPAQSARFLSPFSTGMFATMGIAFAVVLVIANQIPMHNTYQNSIAAIVKSEQLTESLDQGKYTASTAHDIKTSIEKTRTTLDALKLKGVFGVYTSTQCQNAYTIYDDYLEYLGDYVDRKIPDIKDPATLAAFEDLRSYIKDSHEEAQNRIHMYTLQK